MHSLEFLEEKFACIGNVGCDDFSVEIVFVHIGTLEAGILSGKFVRNGLISASFADKNSVKI